MDIEVPLPEKEQDEKNTKRDRLNTWVAITVALLATFSGICKVKDDNIVQAMQQAQADKIDHWSWYQALHVREDVAQNETERLQLMAAGSDERQEEAIRAQSKVIEDKLQKIVSQKADMKKSAEDDQKNYDALNFRDDQFDLSDAMVAIAISLLAIAALAQKRWLYILALVPSCAGVIMGLSGLLGWGLHPDFIIKLLS